jgi:hypothetical protein
MFELVRERGEVGMLRPGWKGVKYQDSAMSHGTAWLWGATIGGRGTHHP